jgi:CelD/BcsL family acetyltransferase involved in cellulose biosynthesis
LFQVYRLNDMQIRVVTELAEFQLLAGAWDSLLEKCDGECSISLTYEWVSSWWQSFGEGQKIYVLFFEKDREIIGIIPLVRVEYRLGFFRVAAFESIDSKYCNSIALISAENKTEIVRSFVSFVKENIQLDGTILRLSLIPEENKFLGELKERVADLPHDFSFQERVKAIAPFIKLPETWQEYFQSLGSNRRNTLNRASRFIAKHEGVTELKYCNVESLEKTLNHLFDLHQERWKSAGIRGTFADTRTKRFYLEVASKFLSRNWLDLSSLTINGEVASVVFGCIFKHKYYVVSFGRNIKYSKYSVGHIHEMYLVQKAISEKLSEYDFLEGNEPYKFYWTKSARRYVQILISKRGIFPGLRLTIIYLFIRVCEIKRYSFKEIGRLIMIKRKEQREFGKMGRSQKRNARDGHKPND